MNQPSLFDAEFSNRATTALTVRAKFVGSDYVPARDDARLSRQMDRVRDFMLGHGGWYTLAEIAEAISEPPSSISAQLRHLRKAKFGGYAVQKRQRTGSKGGTFEYHVAEPMIGAA